jgi:hypothetical protein
VLVWSRYRGVTLLLVVNVLTALAIIAYDVTPIRYILEDDRLQAIVGFEVLAVISAFLAFRGNRPALFFSYAVFGAHLCVSFFAIYFAFFFRLNRLI